MKQVNFEYAYDPDDQTGGLLVLVRDREAHDEERWVATYLEKDEQVKLYNYLKEHLSKD